MKALLRAGLVMLTCVQLVAARGFDDAHVHLNRLEPLLSGMASAGIGRAVVFWGHRTDNQDVLDAAARHPCSLIPFLSVSPERTDPYGTWWRDNDPRLLAYLTRELSRGVYRGIGELSIVHFPSRGFPETAYSPLHPLMTGIMGLARRFRLPVMLHCEMTHARELDQLLARHPDVTVIWAHGGYAPLYWTERMLAAHARLVIELSMRMLHGHPRSPDYWILEGERRVWPQWLDLIEKHPDRFIVGSDATQRDAEVDAERVASVEVLLAQLSPATRAKVATQNLATLVGLGR